MQKSFFVHSADHDAKWELDLGGGRKMFKIEFNIFEINLIQSWN